MRQKGYEEPRRAHALYNNAYNIIWIVQYNILRNYDIRIVLRVFNRIMPSPSTTTSNALKNNMQTH